MTHVVLGFPSLKASIELVRVMADNGARLAELQIPFSDPVADGPTIMTASEEALARGVTPKDCMKAVEQLASHVKIPLLLMSYYNLLYNYPHRNGGSGLNSFFKHAAVAGAQGLIVPDIPPEEEADGYWDGAPRHGLFPVPLVSPLTPKDRLKKISATVQGGFVYCVSTTGTTGSRKELPPGLAAYLSSVRKCFKRPLAVGFGISKKEHIDKLSGAAEIAIVGSAMIDTIRKAGGRNPLPAAALLTRTLAGCRNSA